MSKKSTSIQDVTKNNTEQLTSNLYIQNRSQSNLDTDLVGSSTDIRNRNNTYPQRIYSRNDIKLHDCCSKRIVDCLKKWLFTSKKQKKDEKLSQIKETGIGQKCQSRVKKINSNFVFKVSKGLKNKVKQHLLYNGESCTQQVKLNNISNPNFKTIPKSGLRPIVIDGSNVAMGHGKGAFSAIGLKICIDFFANRGHRNIKVFLPFHRRKHFSEELLEELEAKCDIIFIPSIDIHKMPYDDRFIVQYADEFGGVIVSNDMYRDLIKENPRWAKTIKNRLLMFTWVDDFLMFPIDPLGRKGPTLDQFLMF